MNFAAISASNYGMPYGDLDTDVANALFKRDQMRDDLRYQRERGDDAATAALANQKAIMNLNAHGFGSLNPNDQQRLQNEARIASQPQLPSDYGTTNRTGYMLHAILRDSDYANYTQNRRLRDLLARRDTTL